MPQRKRHLDDASVHLSADAPPDSIVVSTRRPVAAARANLSRAVKLTLGAFAALSATAVHADLPVPCSAGCAGGPATWVTSGDAGAVVQGLNMTITQRTPNAIYNWQSFNIGAENSVEFKQPDANSLALNRIFQADPSRIFGRLTANGQVYLINQNGILFGKTAQVNVGGLVASSLKMTDEAVEKGIARAIQDHAPAFEAFKDSQGHILSGDILVEEGAQLRSADQGRVFLFAPNVTNRGSVETPNGQTVLAAGTKVYVAIDEKDPNLRGLLVEVDVPEVSDEQLQRFLRGEEGLPIGNALNAGSIDVKAGNATMAGLAVNQSGRISATTTVRANGSVYLRAADKPKDIEAAAPRGTRGGLVTLGEGSLIDILPDYVSTEATVDENKQSSSNVDIKGHAIHMLENAAIVAPSGRVALTARADPSSGSWQQVDQNDSRILLERGAVVDVSGSQIELPADRLTVKVQLFSEQLRDSPLQRDGILKGKEVTVDLRRTGVREDGSLWVGTPLADVAGALNAVERRVGERTLTGGTIDLASQGDVILSNGSTLNVSGGRIDYAAGMLNTTKLMSGGKVYDISEADPNRLYDSIVGQYTRKHNKWGVSETWTIPGAETGTFSAAYTQGYDAGRISINAASAVLDASVKGSVSQGQYQRQPETMARGAELVLGYDGGTDLLPNHRLPSIVLDEAAVLDSLTASGFNPRNDVLPQLEQVDLRPSWFGSDGIAHAQIFSNGTITLPADTTLSLAAGGSLELRADAVQIDGTVKIPSGSFIATAERVAGSVNGVGHDITVSTAARFDLRGQWVNDVPPSAAGLFAPVWIDGGHVALSSNNGNVVLAEGSRIDVSGSGWLQANGALRDGKGGSITLAARDNERASSVQLDGELRAFGLNRGGALSVTTDAVCISNSSCSAPVAGFKWLTLAPQFFGEGGFSSYAVSSKRGDLLVASDAQLFVQQRNLQLDATYRNQITGADLATFSAIVLLPDYQRQASQLSLAASRYRPVAPAALSVAEGARITTDPRGTIALSSLGRMFVNGTLQAAGGTIQLDLKRPEQSQGYFANEVLWVGQHATIDASGDVMRQPNPAGLRRGNVLAGGTISIRAARGYVVTEGGSLLNVSGTSTQLDMQGADGLYRPQSIASNAGTINLVAAEGMVLDGAMTAHGGSANALGGSLSLTMQASQRGVFTGDLVYPTNSRVIEVVSTPTASALAGATYETFGSVYPASNNGLARLDVNSLAASGFDALTLTARNLRAANLNGDVALASFGAVRLAGSLNLGRRIVIDAPSIETAASATVSAPYVVIGATDADSPEVPTPSPGTHTLNVQGQWVDVIGSSAVSGALVTHVQADQDLRLRSMPNLDSTTRQLRGALTTVGDLELQATQIYPTTFTDFTLHALGQESTIRVLPGNGVPTPVLSAGGTLRLQAANIDQGGTLRAPFGTIQLIAEENDGAQGQLTLRPGGVTSTSANGNIIPVGRTEGGENRFNWIYDLGNTQKLVLGNDLDGIPAQNIELTGRSVDLQSNAILDVSAGGDMQAYEFVPGVGGSKDVLAATSTGTWAIVPTFGETLAPYDQQESAKFGTRIGTTVHLDGSNGLPPGEYALLPARYALLPGAFLITERPEYADLPIGERRSLLDGTTVVAGRFGVAGTTQVEDRTRGFAVISGETLRDANNKHRPAEYNLTLASAYFAAQSTAAAQQARLPRDAGTVAIEAGESLALQARLRGQAAAAGRGAAVDIAADQLLIAPEGASAANGVVPLSAEALNRLGAESILLGGRRHSAAGGIEIDVVSSSVTVASGAKLQAPELLLAASDSLIVESGATLAGRGTAGGANDTYLLDGGSALLRVAAGTQADVKRTNPNTLHGSMNIHAGAVIAADGAAMIDATANVVFAGTLQLDGADLAVGAAQINLGDIAADAVGFNLDSSQMASLSGSVKELRLRSRSDINLYGAPQFTAEAITLDAGGVIARSGSGTAAFNARTVTFTNTTHAAQSALPNETHGELQISATDIVLGDGAYAIGGVDRVALTASNTIMGRDEATLRVRGSAASAANLGMTAGVISGERAAQLTIDTQGRIDVFASGTTPTLPSEALGARLTLTGDSIHHNSSRIAAQGGRVDFLAQGADGIEIGAGAVIDASGAMRRFNTAEAFAPGGAINLNAATGSVVMAQGALLNVAGASGTAGRGGDAGRIRASAANGAIELNGELRGTAVSGQRQGAIALDAGTIENLNVLNKSLNASGFTEDRVLRVRDGDVVITSDIVAQRIDIAADGRNGGGSISVASRLDARGEQGGTVRLAARNDLIVDSGSDIDVSATGTGKDGGTIELMSQSGGVQLLVGSTLHAHGGAANGSTPAGTDGRVHVRVDRDVLARVATPGDKSVALDGAIDGVREVVVEGFKSYQETDGVITSDQVQAFGSPMFTDAETFMQSADALASALGRAGDVRFHIRPGIEIVSAGDLSLDAAWDLHDWQFGGVNGARESGYLTLSAGQNLKINGDVSDGIYADLINSFGFEYGQTPPNSWSYGLRAGADLGAASPYAVVSSSTEGSLNVGALGSPHVIRTGNGNIELNTAGDVRLADVASAIYTAGLPVQDLSGPMKDMVMYQSLVSAMLVENGGNVLIRAGGDVVGQPTDQLVTDWLWRAGSLENVIPTMWGIEFSRFRQGIGALSGGDVTISAGGNVDNVSAVIPTIGVPLGSANIPVGAPGYSNEVDVRGGGKLRVDAGGDIGGGVYYVGRGSGELRAGRDIRAGTGWTSGGVPLHTTLALGDTQFSLVAGRDLTIESAFNPTLLAPGMAQAAAIGPDLIDDFSTYGVNSEVRATALGGNATISGNVVGLWNLAAQAQTVASSVAGREAGYRVLRALPPSLRVAALSGDLDTGSTASNNPEQLALIPSPAGTLELLAHGDITFNQLGFLISDADPRLLPTVSEPQRPTVDENSLSVVNLLRTFGQFVHAVSPVHSQAYAQSVGYTGPRAPAMIVAETGSIDMSHWNTSNVGSQVIWSAMPMKIIAGEDVVTPNVVIQNVEATDVSMISAGRDLTYPLRRNANQQILAIAAGIAVDGPGQLIVSAGRDIDLKTSPGIVTRGDVANPALADQGANIIAMAGYGSTEPAYDAVFDQYVVGTDAYTQQLLDYMSARGTVGTKAAAMAAFRNLPREQQIPFLSRILWNELRESGTKAVTEGTGDYTAGYAAIKKLFPNIDPTQQDLGDLNLFFSRIYTLDGGDIDAIVPSGVVNVGLSVSAKDFNIEKSPSELGIVAQRTGDVNILSGGDTLVNIQRVFAADGGSILIWSSAGDIDAGRGAKTAISAPPPVITFDPTTGQPSISFPPALAGSGIRAFVTTEGRKAGNVNLFAPTGAIIVNDAGIGSAGDVIVGAIQVIGADNIDVGGKAVGVPPVDAGGLGSNLASASAAAGGASRAASTEGEQEQQKAAPLADTALSWLDVFVVGLGEDGCKQDDLECLKRQSLKH